MPVGVHNVTLANAKELMRAGVEGWLHVPVRGGEVADEELIAIVKDRIARNDRPNIWMTPASDHGVDGYAGRHRPAWLDDPLLRAAVLRRRHREALGRSVEEDDAGGGRARAARIRSGCAATR